MTLGGSLVAVILIVAAILVLALFVRVLRQRGKWF